MVGFVVFGLFVGALARLVLPGKQNLSILMTLAIGLAGSVMGGVAANFLGTGDTFELNFIGSVVAIATAVVLIAAAEKISGSRS